MSGILFIICIPTIEEEDCILEKLQNDVANKNGTSKSSEKVKDNPLSHQYGTFENKIIDLPPQTPKSSICGGYPMDGGTGRRVRLQDANKAKSMSSIPGRDEGDGLRKGLLSAASTKTLFGAIGKEVDLNLEPDAPMVDVVRAIITLLRVENAVWTEGNSHKKWQIIFSVEANPRSDTIVRILNEWGIGDRAGSFVTILPCTLYKNAAENQFEGDDKHISTGELDQQEENGWDRFVSSVTARYNVAQLVDKVRSSGEFTFDFISLLIVASLVALFGLVENNSLFLAASMLISPLMGPILAATFGTVIKDRTLQFFGVVNELYGIAVVTTVGFIGGIIICLVDTRFGEGSGMTNEMINRSLVHSVIIGILVAIPSGIAVAIGILGDNFGSLAGVAISASLLPPAVNTGLMFAFAVIYKIFERDEVRFNTLIASKEYSDHQSIELAVMGAISMCVTITNVISIYLMGIVFLKIKEVAPILPANHRQFWRHDVKIARDYNKSHTEDQTGSLRRTLEDEIAGYEGQDPANKSELLRKLERHFTSSHQKTWSPTTYNLTYHPTDNRRTSIQELFSGQGQPPSFYSHQLTFNNVNNHRINDHMYRRASIATTTTKPRIKLFHPLNRVHEIYGNTPPSPARPVTVSGESNYNTAEKRLDDMDSGPSGISLKKFVVIPVPEEDNQDKCAQ